MKITSPPPILHNCTQNWSEVFTLPGCYAALVGSCLQTFRGSLTVPSSRDQRSISGSRDSLTLDDGGHRSSRSVGKIPTLRNNPKERRPQLHCGGSLNSQSGESLSYGHLHSLVSWTNLLPSSLTFLP